MAIIWRHPRLNVGDATALVNAKRARDLSGRTVATILRRLDAKGYVAHAVDGRAFLYTAVVPEEKFVSWHGRRAVAELLERYGPDVAVAGLGESAELDQAAVQLLDELLQRRRGDAT